ncbi:DUF1997 domain-containing protein [Synechococcus sp. CS-1325]|uniref:DUF1997 domain-containing protein n=1 Tax=unclassified Synechococcus TaxID=2626047 RepID=UPI0021A89BC3|nr:MULTISPECIES: DUF1997 domain-containing protein [unclassified Synechococcus]MCT0198527.1 DUF1997 domain-containing protein [Synechococcus sp. CS-1325]MCT0213729.1 DUF1997 domain-containing protein [Synechococcus sp. CS-1326]MCT0229255.1 DUF1997 domain-containing protein [Synechococcus sp. CS-1324]MCT0233759.1 DUF1997 domain-containing protein [Synechococcus sp. CS-1327]
MPLAFSASQYLRQPVPEQTHRLALYLNDEDRIVRALLDASQLEKLGEGRYRYAVKPLRAFQLQIQPVVQLQTQRSAERLEIEALDCQLAGFDLVDDFSLTLHSWIRATETGLEGEARLAVSVSRPAVLSLIAPKVLEATGRSLLGGILLGMRKRVGQQLLGDFRHWCQEH